MQDWPVSYNDCKRCAETQQKMCEEIATLKKRIVLCGAPFMDALSEASTDMVIGVLELVTNELSCRNNRGSLEP